jgi:hypothetical protein
MHVAVYIIAAFVMVGGFVLASDLKAPLSTIVVVQTVFSAVLLATFGRMEQHLGALVELARNPNAGVQTNQRSATPDARSSDEELLLLGQGEATDVSVVEAGVLMEREFKRFEDGSVEVATLMGPKRFRSMDDAIAYLR